MARLVCPEHIVARRDGEPMGNCHLSQEKYQLISNEIPQVCARQGQFDFCRTSRSLGFHGSLPGGGGRYGKGFSSAHLGFLDCGAGAAVLEWPVKWVADERHHPTIEGLSLEITLDERQVATHE